MIETLLSLPTVLGCFTFMATTTLAGMTVYVITFRLHASRQSDDALKEIHAATGNMLHVVGWLFTLLLSMTFTDVVNALVKIDSAVESEAATITDIHYDLRRIDTEASRNADAILANYTRAVIDQDWPALAEDRLSERVGALLRQLEDEVLAIEPTPFSYTLNVMEVDTRRASRKRRISTYHREQGVRLRLSHKTLSATVRPTQLPHQIFPCRALRIAFGYT